MPGSKKQPPGAPLLLVILDTNVWIKHQLLASPTAAGFLHAIDRLNGRVGVPEIVRLELPEVVARQVEHAAQQASKHLAIIAGVLHEGALFRQPSREAVLAAVERRVRELQEVCEELPLTLDLVKTALNRVVRGSPPNSGSNEQFRDSLILETALAAGRSREVHFVTGDTGFFEERKPERGPAVEILSQISAEKITLSIYADLAECAKRLVPTAPKIEEEEALHQIAEAVAAEVRSSSEQRLFSPSLVRAEKLILNPTKQPGVLSASFDLLYELEPLPQGETLGRKEARLHVLGDCYYDYRSKTASDASLDQLVFSWQESDGTPRRQVVKYLRANIVARGSLG